VNNNLFSMRNKDSFLYTLVLEDLDKGTKTQYPPIYLTAEQASAFALSLQAKLPPHTIIHLALHSIETAYEALN